MEEIITSNEKHIISAPLVFKNFTRKDGKTTDIGEIYLRRSTKDFFIKFCESKISRNELEDQLSKIDGEIKVLTLEVEFFDGNWDICDENNLQQSRIGEYVIIHRIVNEY